MTIFTERRTLKLIWQYMGLEGSQLINFLLFFLIFLFLDYYFISLETALFSIKINKYKLLAEDGDEKAGRLVQYLEKGTKILSCLRYLVVVCQLICVICAFCFYRLLIPILFENGSALKNPIYFVLTLIIYFWVITTILFIFSDLFPRRMGLKNAEKKLFRSMQISIWLERIFRPAVSFAVWIANHMIRFRGIDPSSLDSNITEEEIRLMIDAGEGSGSIDESEKEMINNIFEFDDTIAGDIATHRTDIVALPITASLDEVAEVYKNQKYSRIPVYEENIDNIVGILHVKDLVKYLFQNNKEIHLSEIIKKPFFVPFSKKTDELFEEMRKNKVYMAIIIDEYGGTAGIVTMEDLLETIVGNIFDEYDTEEEEDIQILDENHFLVSGSTEVEELEELLDIEINSEDYDTIAGFIIGQLGRIPDDGEQPAIEYKGYRFQVEQIEDKRIEKIRITKLENENTQKEE